MDTDTTSMDIDTTTNTSSSVRKLEECIEYMYKNNFDAITKVCMVTIIKILDNIIQQPDNEKVRSIRYNNPTFQKKVAASKGGVDFLVACGFEKKMIGLNGGEMHLVLPTTTNGDNSFIITARRLLTKCCIQDLGMKTEELPKYKQPPPATTTTTTTSNTTTTATFDPYKTHRYDGISSAVGVQLTPDTNYVSSTDEELKILQKKQQQLEKKIQTIHARDWVAMHPPSSTTTTTTTTSSSNAYGDDDASTTGKGGGGDSSLLMEQYKNQMERKKKLETGGFTTSNMRELEKLKKQKVYSYCSLVLQFANGMTLQCKFLPKETIQQVIDEMIQDCFITNDKKLKEGIQLYITPPRKVLQNQKTLQEEQLVPAARVFVKLPSISNEEISKLIKPELFETKERTLPQSVPIVSSETNTHNDKKPAATATKSTTNDKKNDSEDDLLRRMMGGKKKLLGGKKK